MAEQSTLQIPKDVLQPIIEAHVSKAVNEALGSHSQLVAKAVEFALHQKVDTDGRPTNYSSDTSFLQWLVRSSIREAATKAVRETLTQDIERGKEIVAKEIKNQRSSLTKKLIENIATAAAQQSTVRVSVSVDGVEAGGGRY